MNSSASHFTHRVAAVSLLVALAVLQLSTAALAQDCAGGKSDLLHQFDGISADDWLGTSVSGASDVDGDGVDDVIVGVYAADPGGRVNAGSAYVYSGATGAMVHQFHGQARDDRFGWSVAGAGDVDGDGLGDLIVGAFEVDVSGRTDAGAAYVYSGATGALIHQFNGWEQAAELGRSVSGAGDVDGDGFDDVIIGAHRADPGSLVDAGSAFVYSGATGGLLHQFHGQAAGDVLGDSVSSAGDVDQDGLDDVIVGAWGADPAGFVDAGSAYVYSGATGTLLHQFDGRAPGDRFCRVSGAGDANGDGFDDLIVGANEADPGNLSDAGSAYVFSGATGALLHQFDGHAAGDELGWKVAGAGDVDGDGFGDVIFGAPFSASAGSGDGGSAYVHSGVTGALVHQFNGQATGDHLGWSVAGAGDVAGDGLDDVIIGAVGASPGGRGHAGSAYVYSLESFLTVDTPSLSASAGGRIQFSLDFPDTEAGEKYALLGSLSGTGPLNVMGGCVPLTLDWFTQSMKNSPPPVFSNAAGSLGAGGTAQATLDVPAGFLSSYAGMTVWFAVATYDTIAGLHFSSIAIPISIVP